MKPWLVRGIWDAALTVTLNVVAGVIAIVVLSFPGLPS